MRLGCWWEPRAILAAFWARTAILYKMPHTCQPLCEVDFWQRVWRRDTGGRDWQLIAKQPASAPHILTHCAAYCTPCRPLLRPFSGWMLSPPPTGGTLCSGFSEAQSKTQCFGSRLDEPGFGLSLAIMIEEFAG